MGALGKLFLTDPEHESAGRYLLVAISVTVVAYALQRAIWPFIPPSPSLVFYPAVFVAARIGGAPAGYLATLMASLAIAHSFLPPDGLAVGDPADVLDLLIFLGVGVGISASVGRLRNALARALRATEAKRSTDATWSMVAHDLRTPLNVISLGSSALETRSSMSREMETVHLIKRSTFRACLLLDDALDAMRATEGKLRVDPRPCDARELCAHAVDAVGLLATRKGVKLECDVSAQHPLACDQLRLERVLTNLLDNAIKFTPRNGVISLDVDEENGSVRFSVKDTGRGIPEAELRSVFGKYWMSPDSGGRGLGLWIAGSILEAHGSRLAVESRVGEGTTFRFKLPLFIAGTSATSALSEAW